MSNLHNIPNISYEQFITSQADALKASHTLPSHPAISGLCIYDQVAMDKPISSSYISVSAEYLHFHKWALYST